MLLSPQGKCRADFRVFIMEDAVILDVEPAYTVQAMQALDAFIITEDVQLENVSSSWACISIEGPLSSKISKGPETYPFGFSGENGLCLFIPANSATSIIENFLQKFPEIKPAGRDAYETRRIENGVLRYGQDFDENVLLSETGLEALTVSETKGCYPGQEVVARIAAYGGLKRELVVLEIQGGKPAVSDLLWADSQAVGKLTSVCLGLNSSAFFGIALLDKQFAGPSTVLPSHDPLNPWTARVTNKPVR